MKLNFNTLDPQEGKLGRAFRISSLQRGKQEKYINGAFRNDWYYVFKYLDDGSFFTLHTELNEKVIEKLNHKETLDLLCTN